MKKLSCKDAQLLTASWALGAIDKEEEARLRAHLESCHSCQAANQADNEALAALAASVPQISPPHVLKERLFRLIETVERERAVVISPLLAHRPVRRLFAPRANFVLALVALVAAVALGGWVFFLSSRLGEVEQLNKELSTITTRLDESNQTRIRLIEESSRLNLLEEKNVQLANGLRDQRLALYVAALPASVAKTLDPTSENSRGWGMFLGSPSKNVGILLAVGLQQLPQGRVYQVWLTDEFGYHNNGGTFNVDGDGFGQIFMRTFKPVFYYRQIWVSIEPEGGSANPTTRFVLGGDI